MLEGRTQANPARYEHVVQLSSRGGGHDCYPVMSSLFSQEKHDTESSTNGTATPFALVAK